MTTILVQIDGSAHAWFEDRARPLRARGRARVNRRLRGATAVVNEAEDGTVTIRANGRVLASRLYPKDHAHLDPGAVVDHQRLDGVFEWIAAQQQERDAARLANPKITLREKQRLRAGAAPRTPTPSTQ